MSDENCRCGCNAPNGCVVGALEAENERLRKKADIADCLEEYAEHTRDCSMPRSWSPGDPDPTTKCNCGLVALELALADIAKQEDGDE